MAFKRISLRLRLFLPVFLILFTVTAGAAGVLWLFRDGAWSSGLAPDSRWEGLIAVRGLQISLAMQKACLFSYVLTGDPERLEELEAQRRAAEDFLTKIRLTVAYGDMRERFRGIKSRFDRFKEAGDSLVADRRSERAADDSLVKEVDRVLAEVFRQTGEAGDVLEEGMEGAMGDFQSRVKSVYGLMLVLFPVCLMLGVALLYVLNHQVLEPIRELAAGNDGPAGGGLKIHDEVTALRERIQKLVEDVDQTHSELRQSREHLVQSEKLAMVGKLAAGVAHSVRNPLTSVKMRLFSLERNLELSPLQKEDFDVISDEIRHIDAILQNFLEFSRPPKLKIQSVSLSDVVDMSVQLLRHRLESYGAEVELTRQQRLPPIQGDPEQLKEVLVNLIINACEAMGQGGKIHIQEMQGFSEPMGRVVVLQISDTGPGIPEAIREQVFQPFFSTKEEGTGLGLSIARRIVEDHRGCLNLRSKKGKGTTFIVTLPSQEDTAWIRS
ncbi:MAG: histidine kinase [Deltaproteobacteria bacterium]|nr:histidine kinase [Deltaproteobacteria bacterium]